MIWIYTRVGIKHFGINDWEKLVALLMYRQKDCQFAMGKGSVTLLMCAQLFWKGIL